MNLVKTLHPILALFLLFAYPLLAWLFRKDKITPSMIALAQTVRFVFLGLYLTGLIMTMNLHIAVNRWHHYLSLLPVLIILFFQLLPTLRKQTSEKMYVWMFFLMFVAVIAIGLAAC